MVKFFQYNEDLRELHGTAMLLKGNAWKGFLSEKNQEAFLLKKRYSGW